MKKRVSNFISALKWPVLAAVFVAAAVALLSTQNAGERKAPASRELEVVARVDMREAMRILHDEHDRVLDQADRQRAETEQKAAEDAHAFEQARLAAAREAAQAAAQAEARKLAEQRAAETKHVADASVVKETRKPKPEPAAPGAPLDIVPVTGGESGPLVRKPQGPIEVVVAKVGDVADEIRNKTVSTVTGIKDWFAAAGDKLLGREKSQLSIPASHLSSAF